MPPILKFLKTPGLTKPKKSIKSKKTKITKKKAAKPVVVTRPSPFKVGDEVWASLGGTYTRLKIASCIKPKAPSPVWAYTSAHTSGGPKPQQWEESELLPNKIFSMIATDAVKMKSALFTASLNDVFGGNAVIYAVYRVGQKRPWAYYVIPELEKLFKTVQWKKTQYGYTLDESSQIYAKSIEELDWKLLPISSAPQEILTYLGLHIYNRQWKKYGKENTSDVSSV